MSSPVAPEYSWLNLGQTTEGKSIKSYWLSAEDIRLSSYHGDQSFFRNIWLSCFIEYPRHKGCRVGLQQLSVLLQY